MSKIKELYAKVAGDSGLQAKFAEIINDSEKAGEEATKEKLVAFAKEAGFEVGFDEMQEFFTALSEQKEGELSDTELDAVAGGKSGLPQTSCCDGRIMQCRETSILFINDGSNTICH